MAEADCGVQETDDPVAPSESHPEVGTGAVLAEKLLTVLAPGGSEALLLLLTGGADLVSQDVVSEVLLLCGHPALRADHLRHQPDLSSSLQVDHLLGGLFSCQLAGQAVTAGGVETAQQPRLQLRTERGTKDAAKLHLLCLPLPGQLGS